MSEARSEHEFEVDGDRYRVVFERGHWRMESFWGEDADDWRGEDCDFAAAEIARLRGLVPPGGEEEKG